MLGGLFKMSGMLILKIVYGKNIDKIASSSWFSVIMILLSIANVFWLLSLLFVGPDSGDRALCITVAIAYPIAIAVWTFLVRKNLKDASANAPKDAEESGQELK